MRVFVINGNKFSTKRRYYKYAEDLFTYELSWETGRNLSAFTDILRGGFGQHDCDEQIKVIWTNMEKSRERLPSNFYNALVEILENTENVIFEKREFGQ